MDQSQVILINMTPWHGPSMDIGTAMEAGYMYRRAKEAGVLLIGYYEGAHTKSFSQRVTEKVYQGAVTTDKDGNITGSDGMAVEAFDLTDNLMVPGAIKESGGQIFDSFEKAASKITALWEAKQALVAEAGATAEPK